MTATLTESPSRPTADSGRVDPPWRRFGQRIVRSPEQLITLLVVVACVVFVVKELQPSQLLKNTTPAGGDMGAHVYLPAYIKRALLPHFKLLGWSPDWYEGFPALTFYFPAPMVAIAVISYVIPYNIAFKLVTVAGLVTLPIAAYALGRLARMRFPGPACLAAATLPYLFSNLGPDGNISGGNIASTMAGEFGFSISLTLALVFLGLYARGLDNGRNRGLAAVVLAACGLSHILPFAFAVVGALVLTAMRFKLSEARAFARRVVAWTLPVLGVGLALIAFWGLPFWWRLPYTTDMNYGKLTDYVASLFPGGSLWLFVLAGIGILLSLLRMSRVGVFLSIMTVLSGLAFVVVPQGIVWNARVFPFWWLCLYLLAGVAFYEVGMLLVDSVRNRGWAAGAHSTQLGQPGGSWHSQGSSVWMSLPVPVITILAALAWVNFPLHNLPFGHTTASGKYDWLGITSSDTSFIPSWVYWNYSGYQNPGKSREQEYFALVDEMKSLGQDAAFGCGTAMWEYEPEENDMGTPDALMLLPYWTNGCIGSEEGLYYESSATTPYHFLNAAELSDQPSDPVRGLDYPSSPQVTEGIKHLQMMGVKYLLADTPDVETAADSDGDLRLVATVGPYSYQSSSTSATERNTWDIYEVLGSQQVVPLLNQPVVVKGAASSSTSWLDTTEAWYLDPSAWDVYLAASGPSGWARINTATAASPAEVPRTPLPSVQVSNIRSGTESISFNVDRTGVPVLIRESYFPNWQVKGASAVYRVSPNLMVVVPTSNHVTLTYGYTPVDWAGFIISLIGLGFLLLFWRLGPARVPPPPRRSGEDDDGQLLPLLAWLPTTAGVPGAVGGGGQADDDASGQHSRTRAVAKVRSTMEASRSTAQALPELLDAVFKAYDIRGTVPDQLDERLASAVGSAFALFAGARRVLVARDMRPSGATLAAAFQEGVRSTGVDVVDLGLCSTDEMYFASGHLDAPGAMFTASHNPADYNGIKLCLAGAKPVGAGTGLNQIRDAVEAALASSGAGGIGTHLESEAPKVGNYFRQDVLDDYASKVRSFVDPSVLRPLKVVADTANGMGGLVVPAVFRGLPFDLEVLFGELDGTFPNHPADPIQQQNLLDVVQRVRDSGADVGLAFDGDADRCFLIDDKGVPVSGSTTTAMVAAALLERNPGSTILYNVVCSKAVPEIIRERGGVPVRTRVGHSYIKAVMANTGALFGGEHSGHYYFRDNYRADSGCIAALVVLEILSRDAKPLSEVRKAFERYADSGEINTETPEPAAVIESVARHYSGSSQDRLDGLTVDLGDWWFNLRPSNTEPLLRLNLEAATPAKCAAHTDEVLTLIREHSRDGSGS